MSHSEQFCQHNNAIKNRGRHAAIHMLKHNFLIDIWHLMNTTTKLTLPQRELPVYVAPPVPTTQGQRLLTKLCDKGSSSLFQISSLAPKIALPLGKRCGCVRCIWRYSPPIPTARAFTFDSSEILLL